MDDTNNKVDQQGNQQQDQERPEFQRERKLFRDGFDINKASAAQRGIDRRRDLSD